MCGILTDCNVYRHTDLLLLLGARAILASLFGKGTGPVFLYDVQCVGGEDEILSCLHAGIGNHKCGEGLAAHSQDVAVSCAGIGLLT